jgi:DNA gyrase subunit A
MQFVGWWVGGIYSGVAHKLKAHKIPLGSRTSRGVPFPQVIPVSSELEIASILPLHEKNQNDSMLFLTLNGMIKKVPLSKFTSVTARGLKCITLEENDSLKWVRSCKEGDDIIVATRFTHTNYTVEIL